LIIAPSTADRGPGGARKEHVHGGPLFYSCLEAVTARDLSDVENAAVNFSYMTTAVACGGTVLDVTRGAGFASRLIIHGVSKGDKVIPGKPP
jgi:hypothetical protein